jgi:hypothetical protein
MLTNDRHIPVTTVGKAIETLMQMVALGLSSGHPVLSGLTDSYKGGHHLQSYCLCANQHLLMDPAWQLYWMTMDPSDSSAKISGSIESSLSVALASAGVELSCLFPLIKRLFISSSIGTTSDHCNGCPIESIDPTYHLWECLFIEGHLFMNKELLLNPSAKIGSFHCLKTILQQGNYSNRDVLLNDIEALLASRAFLA